MSNTEISTQISARPAGFSNDLPPLAPRAIRTLPTEPAAIIPGENALNASPRAPTASTITTT